jgi:hypothetical protein
MPALGSVLVTHHTIGHIRKVIAVCTGSVDNGTIPATALPSFEGRLLDLMTIPGAVKPTDQYDVTVETADGFDVLQGVGADRATATNQKAAIVYSGTGTHPTVDEGDVLTLKIANQAVHSAVVTIHLYYALGG